jgi:hypothetical protein
LISSSRSGALLSCSMRSRSWRLRSAGVIA